MKRYEYALREAITKAVQGAGVEGLKKTSLFLSNEMSQRPKAT